MNIIRQQKQAKKVVEHKGSINFDSQALVLPRAQSLTWDTLFAEISRISLVAVHLQLIQEFAWDTFSRPKNSDDIQETSLIFYFVHAISLLGRPSQDILRILHKFLSRTVADPPFKKLCPDAASWWLTG